MVASKTTSTLTSFFLFTVFVILVLVTSCQNQKDKEGPVDDKKGEQTTQGTVLPGDTSSAKELAGDESKVTTLKYTPKKGDVFRYKLTQLSKVTQEGGVTATSNSIQFFTQKVTDVKKDGRIELSIRYDSIIVNNLTVSPKMRNELTFDSRKKEDKANPDFKQYNAIIGAEVTVLVKQNGEIEDIIGHKAVLEKALGDKKDSLTAQQREMFENQLKNEIYLVPLQQEFQFYNDNGMIDSSQSWFRENMIPIAGIFPAKSTLVYKIENVREVNGKKIATISSNITTDITKKKLSQNSVEFVLKNSTISGVGKSMVDVEKGTTIYKSNTISMDLDVEAVNKENKEQKQRMKQSINSQITIELIK